MATVVLVGTLDTKGEEYGYLADRVRTAGARVLLVDTGVVGPPLVEPDIARDEVAAAAGVTIAALASAGDRGAAVEAMARGAAVVVRRLHAEGRLDAIAGLGGSGGAAIISQAMQALPVGIPKLLVSTMAAGDTRPYVGTVDVALLYPVVDIAGLNRLSERILANAAAAIAGMAGVADSIGARGEIEGGQLPLVGATMFGVTTPCVTVAREWLESRGYEVLVFHATGTGGRAMEGLIRAGFIGAVLDVTTTELADELVGGVLSAGPDRLEAAGHVGLPQVVSLGALDMVNFGPPDSVPERFRDRTFYRHNPSVTLMRTTAAECAELGTLMAGKLNAARGPVTVFVPLGGLSAIDVPGAPFHEPEAGAALVRELKAGLRAEIEVVEMDVPINDPGFATAMAQRLDRYVRDGLAAVSATGAR
ncbi:MAG TPA: Tm-1-like ATP-binding domain-containing protein [Candidatus Limnocylindrales bacterium]|nr:Tm-1-like ATP-binding domain-containing protein [Candidatus Limnocylindrales bacterium]